MKRRAEKRAMLPHPGRSPADAICLHASQIFPSISPLLYDIGNTPAKIRRSEPVYSDLEQTYLAQNGQGDMLGSRGTVSLLRPTLNGANLFSVFLGNATVHMPPVMLPPPPLLSPPDISMVSLCLCTMMPRLDSHGSSIVL